MTEKKHTKPPIAKCILALIYLILWLVPGLLAALFHLIARPHYINLKTCIIGGIANLFGPFARPLAAGWPNAGKPPHTPLVPIGLVLIAVFAALILLSMISRRKWLQILCLFLFVPSVLFWIRLGFRELLTCAL
jgi:hypothetical protein